MVCPVMTTANHGSEPTRGTRIKEVVTRTTPIAPPHHIHHGKSRGEDVNVGGKVLVNNESMRMMAVPLANEISEA